jgi:hypothetical protein
MADNREKHSPRTSAAFYGEMYGIGSDRAEQPRNELLDARDYLSGHAAKWLIEKVNRARQCQRVKNALAAITQNQSEQARKRGMDLAGSLAAFACLEVSNKRGGGKKSFEKLAALGTGKTWKALAEFPERVRRMAREVEQVNASPRFAPPIFANADNLKAQRARKYFNMLPGIMLVYAGGLEAHIKRVPGFFEESFPRSSGGPSQWLLLLSYTVRVATDKWRDREVAELLSATAIALGKNREFDAQTIAQARSRLKKTKT